MKTKPTHTPNCGEIKGQQCPCPPPVKVWSVTAHETIVHTWTVEAETEELAHSIALDGCPLMDMDCESAELEIITVKEEVCEADKISETPAAT